MIAELDRISIIPGANADLPLLPVCPTCGTVTGSRKMTHYARAWETLNSAVYPAVDATVPCYLHGAA